MRQLLYVSTSHVGPDPWALDLLTVQSGANNALAEITGLLWTDGLSFSQVIEGPHAAIAKLWATLQTDTRHCNIKVVADHEVEQRQYGSWAMHRPPASLASRPFEQRMVTNLAAMGTALSDAFSAVVRGSRAA